MNSFKITSSSLLTFSLFFLAGCIGKDLSDHPDLLTASAHCKEAQDFSGCLLASYVNHPASLSFPEELRFSTYYAQIVQTGYDRKYRRKLVNKFVKNKAHKERMKQAFLFNDMYLHASAKTPEGTRAAISIVENDEKAGLRHLDPSFQQWLDNPAIFDNDFAQALLKRYSKSWMQKSVTWDRTGLTPRKSPHEILSQGFEKIEDTESARKMMLVMKQQRYYPLRQMLKPVYSGQKQLSQMNGKKLKEAGFSAMAIMPLIERQISKNTEPRIILSNLAYAIRHGHADNTGDVIVEKALNYAYKRRDSRAIFQFADQIKIMPEDFSNSLTGTLKRADRLSQDVVVIQYLDALGAQKRIKQIASKWDLLSKPLSDGKLPSWTGTTTFDYTKILHHAGRASDVQKYIQAWEGKLMYLDENAEFSTTMASRAVTVEKVKKLEAEVNAMSDPNLMQKFYTRCANDGGISSQKYEVRNYCLNKIQSASHRIGYKLKLATQMYKEDRRKIGRELTQQALSEAAECACVEEKPFSDNSYYLADIILAELN